MTKTDLECVGNGVYRRLNLQKCDTGAEQDAKGFWESKGIPYFSTDDFEVLCLDDSEAYIESDPYFFVNYAGIRFVVEFCINYNS